MAPKMLFSPTLQRNQLRFHRQNVGLHQLHQGISQLRFFSKVKVLAPCYAHENFYEFKSIQCIVIILLLIDFFKISSDEISIEYWAVYLIVHKAGALAEFEKLSFVHVWWRHAFYCRCDENFLQVLVTCFYDAHDCFISLFVAANLFHFPIEHVVLQALFQFFLCIWLPPYKYWLSSLKNLLALSNFELLRHERHALFSNVWLVPPIVPSESYILVWWGVSIIIKCPRVNFLLDFQVFWCPN